MRSMPLRWYKNNVYTPNPLVSSFQDTLQMRCGFHTSMAFSWIVTVIGVLCQMAVFCTGKVIYHQTMTPSWLEAHASYIDSSRTATTKQLTFNAGTVVDAALLKIPLIAAGFLKVSSQLTIKIIVANDISIGGKVDSDIKYGVSDGTRFMGFFTTDKGNVNRHAPCYGCEGVSGSTLTSIRYGALLPKPTETFYAGRFVMTLKLNERWGSCYTAHDAGFVRTAKYDHRLMLSNGLTLEVYKSDKGERVGIRYIKVTIIQDDA